MCHNHRQKKKKKIWGNENHFFKIILPQRINQKNTDALFFYRFFLLSGRGIIILRR